MSIRESTSSPYKQIKVPLVGKVKELENKAEDRF